MAELETAPSPAVDRIGDDTATEPASGRGPGLHRLLRPSSIALVGASERSFYATNTWRNLIDNGFTGELLPVNPTRPEVFGHRSYPTVADLPVAPDNVVLLVRREDAVEAAEQAVRLGAGGLTVLSAGFADARDTVGEQCQARLVDLARRTGLPLVGPNCLGFVNAADRVALWSAPLRFPVRSGPIAVVSQSGGSSGAIYRSLVERELDVGWFVTAGNQATLEVSDYLAYLVEDPATRILVCFVEGVRNAAAFRTVLGRARALNKPVVVLKTGRSSGGRAATLAHTGSMAGSDAVFDAVCRADGVIRVADFEELTETLALLYAVRHWPAGVGGPAVISVSGGACALIADKADEHGLPLAALSTETTERLTAAIPPSGNTANPIDCTGQALQDLTIYERVLDALDADTGVGSVIHSMSAGLPAGPGPHRALLEMVDARGDDGRMPILLALNKQNLGDDQRRFLREHPRMAYIEGLGAGLRAVAHVAARERRLRGLPTRGAPVPEDDQIGHDVVGRYADGVKSEWDSLALLAAAGLPTVARERAATADGCGAAASRLGFPVVLKADLAGVAHKSALGAVAVGLRNAAEVTAAAREMRQLVSARAPGSQWRGYLVEQQVTGVLELIVGAVRDPQFGPVLLVGRGGVHTELIADRTLIATPAEPGDVRVALADLAVYPELAAHGQDAVRAVVDAVLVVQAAMSGPDGPLAIDVNPLLVLPAGEGVMAVDALVVAPAGTTHGEGTP